ncbi:MAG: M20/M25/M40 family metallo-hydrolase [Planctomycetota bacterium]
MLLPWLLAVMCLSPSTHSETLWHTRGEIELQPEKGQISWTFELSPAGAEAPDLLKEALEFDLHSGLEVDPPEFGTLTRVSEGPRDHDPGIDPRPEITRNRWLWTPPAEGAPFRLSAKGVIQEERQEVGGGSSRSFSSTAGTIEEQGVFLAGSSAWIPQPVGEMVTFDLRVSLPAGWDAVSQGKREEHSRSDEGTTVQWKCDSPQEEIYLVAARFFEYTDRIDNVELMAFLREDDSALASRYLEASQQYIRMYSDMLGPYPQPKFALVENFWETGYGMPSFTLLGPQVIRLPFILRSSYPHEILHDYWGNSVYVDVDSGNWCEGLTAYMADHLMKEVDGLGHEYRRDVLQKYGSYVQEGQDFPLTEFRSRHSGATEAVGYGKSLMLWHMIRREVGDESFLQGLSDFYQRFRYKKASFSDLANCLQEASTAEDWDIPKFVEHWTRNSGAPRFKMQFVLGSQSSEITLEQVQEESPFPLRVPVYFKTLNSDRWQVSAVEFPLVKDVPRRVTVDLGPEVVSARIDPHFDVFRKLEPEETPPTLGDIFGTDQGLIVLPQKSADLDRWKEVATQWARTGNFEVVEDGDPGTGTKIGVSKAVWYFGMVNEWAAKDFQTAPMIPDEEYVAEEVAGIRAHEILDRVVGWVTSPVSDAIPGLGRKLPHYGKYSYLAFRGVEPTNFIKGQWQATGSALSMSVLDSPLSLPEPERTPLGKPGQLLDPEKMLSHIRLLTAPEMEGRGNGSEGLARAVNWLRDRFAEMGLEPAAPDGSFIDRWSVTNDQGEILKLENVLGMIPGSDPSLSEKPVVVMAHIDHLGRGWPDVRSGNEGKLHPGADDNASGVAVLVETARKLKRTVRPLRPILFVATSGEEWGLKGSQRLVSGGCVMPLVEALTAISIDAVGRYRDGSLLVLGAGTATEWVHIVRGVGFTTGIKATSVNDDPGGSDHVIFHKMGIPGVQLTTGAHEDFHRPGDTFEKINGDGLVLIYQWLNETLGYLGNRVEPLTSTLGDGASNPAPRSSGSRKVYLGTVPDFADPGPGVRFDSVMPDSPAEKSGVKAGDRLLKLNGEVVEDLRMYSQLLSKLEPGTEVTLAIQRNDKVIEIQLTPSKR